MAVIAPFSPSITGTGPTPAAANNADQALAGRGRYLVVINGSGSPMTATLTAPGNLPTGDAYPDKVYTVAAGDDAWIPLLPVYGNADGLVDIEYSSTTTVTRYVLKV